MTTTVDQAGYAIIKVEVAPAVAFKIAHVLYDKIDWADAGCEDELEELYEAFKAAAEPV